MGKCQGASCGVVLVVSTYLAVAVRQCEETLPDYGDKAHIEGLSPRQLHVFDEPRRGARGWVMSVRIRAVAVVQVRRA